MNDATKIMRSEHRQAPVAEKMVETTETALETLLARGRSRQRIGAGYERTLDE